MFKFPRSFVVSIAAVALAASAVLATAQAVYPNKAVFLVVPYPAGGPLDITARKVLPALQASLGQPVLVDNVAGASGSIGVNKVLNAPSDGYMLLAATLSDPVLAPLTIAGIKYKAEDLRLVGQLSYNPFVLLARTSLPVKNAEEFVAYAGKPGNRELFYGSIGPGSLFHLVTEDFNAKASIRMTHVPYKGLAPMVQDLMGGQVDVAFYPLAGNVFDLIESGKVKALAITGGARHPRLKDVETLNESKVVKDFNHTIWPGIFVPASTPEPVVARLNAMIADIVRSPEFRKFCEESGTTPTDPPMSLAQAAQFYSAEIARIRAVAKQVKLEPQ